jgi:hypothetical protein
MRDMTAISLPDADADPELIVRDCSSRPVGRSPPRRVRAGWLLLT